MKINVLMIIHLILKLKNKISKIKKNTKLILSKKENLIKLKNKLKNIKMLSKNFLIPKNIYQRDSIKKLLIFRKK